MKIKYLSQMLVFGLLCGTQLLIIVFILWTNFVPAVDIYMGDLMVASEYLVELFLSCSHTID